MIYTPLYKWSDGTWRPQRPPQPPAPPTPKKPLPTPPKKEPA